MHQNARNGAECESTRGFSERTIYGCARTELMQVFVEELTWSMDALAMTAVMAMKI